MKRSLSVLVLLAVVSMGWTSVLAADAPAPSPDEEAVKKLSTDFAEAWAKHDGAAQAAFWAADGDLIDPMGEWVRGHDELVKFFTEKYAEKGDLHGTTFELTSQTVRLITPDVALDDWAVTIHGMTDAEGKNAHDMTHRVPVVLHKTDGKWLIVAARPAPPAPAKPAATEAAPAK